MKPRNWWIVVHIDGRKTELYGGPARKDGGFTLKIFQRNRGESILAKTLEGYVKDDKLILLDDEGNNFVTVR